MAKAVTEIEQDIRALSSEAWLETSQRRYRELIEGQVEGVPGPLIFERLRARFGR